ncbi:MAG TPA: hypothetical protein VHN77_07530 [Phycisphaerales bacterium]|nr:hypothetical protein [Phycisphaerales bacterium]
MRLPATLFGVLAVAGSAAHCVAQVASPQVLAYTWMPVPGDPGAVISHSIDSIAVSPDGGTVAFQCLTTFGSQPGGVFAIRGGQLSRAVLPGAPVSMPSGAFLLGTAQHVPLSANDSGDVLVAVSTTMGNAIHVSPGDGGSLRAFAYRGLGLPELPGRQVLIANSVPVGTMVYPPLPSDGSRFAWCDVTPQVLDSVEVSDVLLYGQESAPGTLAAVGPVASGLDFISIASVLDISNSGVLVRGVRHIGGGPTDGVWRCDPASGVISAVLTVGQPAPGILGATVTGISAYAINDSGQVAVLGDAGTSTQAVWVGQGVADTLVLRTSSGQVVGAGGGAVQVLGFPTAQRPLALGEDGWAATRVVCQRVGSTAQTGATVRMKAGLAAQVFMWEDEDIKGAPAGTRLSAAPLQNTSTVTAPWTGRMLVRAAFPNNAGPLAGKTVVVAPQDDGAPTLALVGGQSVELAPGDVRVLRSALLPTVSTRPAVLPDDRLGVIALVEYDDATANRVLLKVDVPAVVCGDIDFNNDGLFPDTQDIADYLDVFAGGACPTPRCDSIDVNRDTIFPDTADIEAFLRVFGGGSC